MLFCPLAPGDAARLTSLFLAFRDRLAKPSERPSIWVPRDCFRPAAKRSLHVACPDLLFPPSPIPPPLFEKSFPPSPALPMSCKDQGQLKACCPGTLFESQSFQAVERLKCSLGLPYQTASTPLFSVHPPFDRRHLKGPLAYSPFPLSHVDTAPPDAGSAARTPCLRFYASPILPPRGGQQAVFESSFMLAAVPPPTLDTCCGPVLPLLFFPRPAPSHEEPFPRR